MFLCDIHTMVTERGNVWSSDIPDCILSSKTKFSLKDPMFILTKTDNMTIFQLFCVITQNKNQCFYYSKQMA